jgi:signal transduction histidine kinase
VPPHSPETEQVLLIARSIAGETGHALLARLVEALSEHLDAAFVAVTYGEGAPPTHARALYALQDHKVARGIRYELQGTPCARVYAGEVVIIPCGIADLYPREARFEGYIGIPLRDTTGEVTGHLAVFSNQEIKESEIATAISTIFALRAEAELRRLSVEKERKKLIADLARMNRRLQQGYSEVRRENAEKIALMGLIAHDLRSPLAAVLSQAELGLARTRSNAPDQARIGAAFQKVIDNADRIAQLIDATLDRARVEGEALRLDRKPVDLTGLLHIAAEANREEAARKSISLSVDPPQRTIAEVDETLVISAIDNLISNAVKYTYPGGEVRISVAQEGESVTVAVSDTGQGLTPDDLTRAFGRFQRLSAQPTDGEKSTGLGLANVREIACAHGGSAHAESEGPGKGSRFVLTLPCHPDIQPAP